jgi:aminopeptidase N
MVRAARAALDYCTRELGPYPHGQLRLVERPGRSPSLHGSPVDMWYQEGFALLDPTRDPRDVDFVTAVVAHEVAHQWWYGIVGDDQYREPWLDEGFATYFEEPQYPILDGCDPRRPYGIVAPDFRRFALDSSMGVWDANPEAYPDVVYLGGACALDRLESDIGRTRMTAFFQLLQKRFRFGVMRTSDVVDAIRTVAPSYDVAGWIRLAHISSP